MKKYNFLKNHKTVTVKVDKKSAEIDEKIAPLIKRLWELDVATLFSCEESPNEYIHIEFASPTDAENFLNFAVKTPPCISEWEIKPFSLLHQRVCPEITGNKVSSDKKWIYRIRVPPQIIRGGFKYSFSVSIHFPQSDLQEIMNNLNNRESLGVLNE
jgi:hypothetical protein